MAETYIVVRAGAVIGTHTWTTGFAACSCPSVRWTERDVLARALWLENNGQPEEAEELLSDYLATHSVHGLSTRCSVKG